MGKLAAAGFDNEAICSEYIGERDVTMLILYFKGLAFQWGEDKTTNGVCICHLGSEKGSDENSQACSYKLL